ncbi:ATP-binding cassette domain-containing protein [Egibacter rhizosphaerae]|uniref:ATP-binding cassette domain-containing protein n=1 Tax=Egibacter rhizosphaerae TaxID=1670831 RepID=A0A411YHA3_9ACTN|nr:ATP-binding cassette domain-containing protein [Egibacter rhizosphaerae]QBI20597.1 ATP-binding cassette domain-containing protein [Egibacter rhizosphaerae]
MSVLRLRGVGLRRDGRVLVGGVDWEVEEGQRWALLGPNGAGKTSLLEVASTYELPSDGVADVLGARVGRVDLRELRRRVGVAGPTLTRRLRPESTVLEAVLTGPRATLTAWGQSFDEAEVAAARGLLTDLGLGGLAERRVGTLSDGERQRTQLARVLRAGETAASPELVLLDEPAAGLDVGGRELLLDRLERLVAPRALVLVSHHLEELPPSVTHALILRDGGVHACGPVDEVLTGLVLSDAFGVPLEVRREQGRWHARRAD